MSIERPTLDGHPVHVTPLSSSRLVLTLRQPFSRVTTPSSYSQLPASPHSLRVTISVWLLPDALLVVSRP